MNTNHAAILGTRAAVLLAFGLGAATTASAQYAPAPAPPNSAANAVNAAASLVTGQPAAPAGYYYPSAVYPGGATYTGRAAVAAPYAQPPGYAPAYPTTTYYQSGYRGYAQPGATYAGQQYVYPQQTYPYSRPTTGNRYVDAARTLIQPQYQQPVGSGYYYQQPGVRGLFHRR